MYIHTTETYSITHTSAGAPDHIEAKLNFCVFQTTKSRLIERIRFKIFSIELDILLQSISVGV